MPYYVIRNYPIFISHQKEKILVKETLKDKSAVFKINRIISGTKENKQFYKLCYKYLQEQYAIGYEVFLKKWVLFDIEGEDAQHNISDLLYDYCHYYKNGLLFDLRNYYEKLQDDYIGDTFAYPMGKTFLLEFNTESKYWKRLFFKSRCQLLRFIINTEYVNRLKGKLTNFHIYFDDFVLSCSRNITVCPRRLFDDKSTKQ